MKILITGSTGFIGKHLSSFLTQTHDLVEVSREKGYDLSKPGFTKTIEEKDADVIIHLAQSKHYREFPKQVNDIYHVNCSATLELLEWGRKNKIKNFIFASTGSVYKPSDEPISENSQVQPQSFYGASKLIAEELCKQYSKYFEVVILRIFTCYGPGQKNMLIANMIDRVKNNKEISLASGMGIIFNPIYIDDLVFSINNIINMDSLSENPLILNLGGKELCSLKDIVNIVESNLNLNANVKISENNPLSLVADISKLTTMLKVEHFCEIKKGIENTILKK